MKVYGTACYAVSEGGVGIQVFDLSQIDSGIVTLATTIETGGTLATHTVAVDTHSGFLYRAGGGSSGLRIYSLANPLAPLFVGSWSSRYVHECQAVTYTSGPYAGKQIVFACAGLSGGFEDPSLDILDVTNKSNIVLLDRFRYSDRAYSHQGWLSEDRQWFYLNDELDETGSNQVRTRVLNVSSLANPVEHPPITTGSTAIDHNLYVHQGRLYQANYTSGLHVFDLSVSPTNPPRVAWFDTWPENDAATFNSLWNNYPFLPSGIVLGSDIEKGLFVWHVGPAEIDFAFPAGPPGVVNPQGESVALDILAAPGVLAAGSARLHVDVGTGWTEIALAPQPGGGYLAPFPAAACGTHYAWYVSARTTGGRTWTAPRGAPTLVSHATAALSEASVLVDRCETPNGWTGSAPGDDATEGRWVHGDPNGTTAQPEDDHTYAGRNCWFTGQGPASAQVNFADVDDGTTTLRTPVYDLAALADPVISYWRWYSNAIGPGTPYEDVLRVDVSNDGGASWTNVEVVGPTGDVLGGWRQHQFRLRDLLPPTSQVQVRFVASDLGNASTVEAAIDDFAIADVVCAPPGPAVYCTAKLNSQGCLPAISASGTPSATAPAPFTIGCANVLSHKPGILIWGLDRAATPFQGATLCIAAPVRRTPLQDSGGNPPPVDCSGTFAFDFNALIQSGVDPLLAPGTRVAAQYWSRDPLDPLGFGSSLSDAVEFTIQP
jgi:choice-of-anchor B domain-containing protein